MRITNLETNPINQSTQKGKYQQNFTAVRLLLKKTAELKSVEEGFDAFMQEVSPSAIREDLLKALLNVVQTDQKISKPAMDAVIERDSLFPPVDFFDLIVTAGSDDSLVLSAGHPIISGRPCPIFCKFRLLPAEKLTERLTETYQALRTSATILFKYSGPPIKIES